MNVCAHIINDSPVKLWGLTSRQRLGRVLDNAGVTDIVDDIAAVPENSTVLLLRGDYLYDDRVIHHLVQTPNMLLKISQKQTGLWIGAHVAARHALQAREAVAGAGTPASLPEVRTETLETLSISFRQRLLKFEPPFVLPITAENGSALERRLFDWSYKGVTDLVTKWVWPRPARWAVGQCVRWRLSPNHVTIIGLILVILAGFWFAYGWYAWGLLAGGLMTFLDTVDGKLARVTVTSSRFGHYFDHIINLFHPIFSSHHIIISSHLLIPSSHLIFSSHPTPSISIPSHPIPSSPPAIRGTTISSDPSTYQKFLRNLKLI